MNNLLYALLLTTSTLTVAGTTALTADYAYDVFNSGKAVAVEVHNMYEKQMLIAASIQDDTVYTSIEQIPGVDADLYHRSSQVASVNMEVPNEQ